MRGRLHRGHGDNEEEDVPETSEPTYWDYVPPRHRDIELLEKAPTLQNFIRERQKRIAILCRGRDQATNALGKLLRKAPEGKPASTPACPLNARKFQRFATSRIKKAFKGALQEGKAWIVTVSDHDEVIYGSRSLLEFDVEKSHRKMRKRLERCLLPTVIVFAVLEFKYSDQDGTFLPHYHMFIAGCEKVQLEPLRRHYPKVRGMANPMMVQLLKDPLRQISYGLKFNIYRRKQRRGKMQNRAHRLKVKDFRNHMLFLAKHGLSKFLFAINGRLA